MTTTPDPTPTQETPMTDPTRPDDGWPHEQLDPDSPTGRVHRALVQAHPLHLTADDIQDILGGAAPSDPASTLAELEDVGIVTPSTREPDAVWMLHGPARLAADKATRDA